MADILPVSFSVSQPGNCVQTASHDGSSGGGLVEWTQSETARRAVIEAGGTVVAHCRESHDSRLVAWAKQTGIYVLIDRKTKWGNPFVLRANGNRDLVCEKYRAFIVQQSELMEELPRLRGKVLGCHCFPKRCHGGELISILESQSSAES